MKSANSTKSGVRRGVVRYFDDARGYGFIAGEHGGDDTFVHYSGIIGPDSARRRLLKGQYVEYELSHGERGPIAINVQVRQP